MAGRVLLHGSSGQSAMEDMTAGLSFTIRVSLSQAASAGCLKVIHTQMSVKKESFLSKILEVYPHLECSFDFKKPADIKKSLSDQIHAAEDKKQPTAETDNNSREKTDERSL